MLEAYLLGTKNELKCGNLKIPKPELFAQRVFQPV